MCNPQFELGDKAEYNAISGWESVVIKSEALRYVSRPGCIYLAERPVPSTFPAPFLVHEDRLRPVERWVRCDGRHRVAALPSTTYDGVLERLVE